MTYKAYSKLSIIMMLQPPAMAHKFYFVINNELNIGAHFAAV